MAQILTPTAESIGLAAAALRRDEVVGMPTETVYGLAGRIHSAAAISRIFAAKGRPSYDPLIVHIARPQTPSLASLSQLVDAARLTAVQRAAVDRCLKAFWPGALTMVLPKQAGISSVITGGLDTVAVRCPHHPVAQALLEAVGEPLAAPSANRFGRISPTSAADVQAELGDRIAYILDGGPCAKGLESTVVAVAGDGLQILRPGAVGQEELQRAAQLPVSLTVSKEIQAPGMLDSHYAPRKRLHLVEAAWDGAAWQLAINSLPQARPLGVLLPWGNWTSADPQIIVRTLSARGDEAEASQSLFSTLRWFDQGTAQELVAVAPPRRDGLWLAIADRLRRAATPPRR